MPDTIEFIGGLLSRLLALGLFAFSLLDSIYTSGNQPRVIAKLDGSDTQFHLTDLKGFFRRRLARKIGLSIVKFGTGTGVHLPGMKQLWSTAFGFPVDVVFLSQDGTILSVEQFKPVGENSLRNPQASSLFVVNRGEAESLKVGQKLNVVTHNRYQTA